MTTYNPATPSNDIGLFIEKSRRLTVDVPFGTKASWVVATTGGIIVWKDLNETEANVISTEAGQWLPLKCDIILSSAEVDGVTENTTASGMFWAAAGA